MKDLLKISMTLILGVILFGLTACGDDDDTPKVQLPVTQSEIQGTWHTMSSNWYYVVNFSGKNYTYTIMDIKTQKIDHRESGTYTLNQTSIVFKRYSGESDLGDCKIYWENTSKTRLHIWPIGSFEKTK